MNKLSQHLFASSSGELYDTRVLRWSQKPPLREVYRRTYQAIETVAQFKATLRNGAFAWPGGYPLFLLTADGATLHFDCARKNARDIYSAIGDKRYGASSGWRVVACDVNWEDSEMQCAQCSKRIESAYSED